MTGTWTRLRRYPALLLLILVYGASCLIVLGTHLRAGGNAANAEDKIVLRMAHWQLETGTREAVDRMIRGYQELHPNVEVRQILIPEEGYFRWVNTQLIGRTAPDMIEIGSGPAALWLKFFARYFIPLDQYVDEPNPYNEGTQFEDTPWRLTYFDEMEGGYSEELQSYYRVPLSAFTVRLYYNRDLIEKVWGPDFPTTYAGLIELCKKLAQYGREEREGFVPVSGSRYNFLQFFRTYQAALTAPYQDVVDTDYNGASTKLESAAALYSGDVSMFSGGVRANFEVIEELSQYFPPGYWSLDRDEAVFLFLQGHTAMITTGSWDYSSIAAQADFRLGVAPIPVPSKSDPRYGPHVAGPRTEAGIVGGFPFGITKVSKHPDVALDFLRYASSLKANEQVNREMYWLPAIRDAEPREELKAFTPMVEGYLAAVDYEAPDVDLDYKQRRSDYLSGGTTYEEFATGYLGDLHRKLPEGADLYIANIENTLLQQMQFGAVRRAALCGAQGAGAALSGDPSRQHKRIMEAYVNQLSGLNNDVRTWVHSVESHGQDIR